MATCKAERAEVRRWQTRVHRARMRTAEAAVFRPHNALAPANHAYVSAQSTEKTQVPIKSIQCPAQNEFGWPEAGQTR